MFYVHPDREAMIREAVAEQELLTRCDSPSISANIPEKTRLTKQPKTESRRSQENPAAGVIDLTSPVLSAIKRKSKSPEVQPEQNCKRRCSRDASSPAVPILPQSSPTMPTSSRSPSNPEIFVDGATFGGPYHLTILAYDSGCVPSTWHDRNDCLPDIAPTEPLWHWTEFDELPLGAWDDGNGHEFANEEPFWEAWNQNGCDKKLEMYECRGLVEGLIVYEQGGMDLAERAGRQDVSQDFD